MGAPSPYRVLHVVVAGQIGGAERFLASLAVRPAQSGAEHFLALMTPNASLRDLFVGAGLKVHDRGRVCENPAAYLWRSYGPADLGWLCGIAKDEGTNILHAHTYGSHVLAARAGLRLGLPVTRTEHGVRHYRDLSCALNRHWALRHTDSIVAVSEFVGRTVAALAPEAKDRIVVVPNGIDMEHFRPVPALQDGPFTFGIFGRLEPVKRVHLAVEAVAQVPGIRLLVVGDGRERARLERLVLELRVGNRVQFLGHVDDPRPAMAACDGVINTTREEALGLAAIEASAMQRPVVAIASGGIPEIVQDGETGWLVQQAEPRALAAVLAEVATDRGRAARMGAAARSRVANRFGVDAMCAGYAKVYKQLITSTEPK